MRRLDSSCHRWISLCFRRFMPKRRLKTMQLALLAIRVDASRRLLPFGHVLAQSGGFRDSPMVAVLRPALTTAREKASAWVGEKQGLMTQ